MTNKDLYASVRRNRRAAESRSARNRGLEARERAKGAARALIVVERKLRTMCGRKT